MDHKDIKQYISSYHDGELDEPRKKIVEAHVRECEECRQEYEEMKNFEEVMSQMELKKPPEEIWKIYMSSVYNRLERKIGWIFLSIGAMILLFLGGYKLVEAIIQDPETSIALKIGILAFLAGVVVMLVSLGRETLFLRKRERYREIEK